LATMGAQYAIASLDGGPPTAWVPVTSPFPPSMDTNNGLTYSAHRKAFFIWHNTCGNKVLTDAVLQNDFDYLTK